MSTTIRLLSTSRFIITVVRPGSGSYVDNEYVPGVGSTFQIIANVQPMSPIELLNIPEGQRARAGIKLYTDVLMQTVSEENLQKGDIVNYDNSEFQVQRVTPYLGQHLRHTKAECLRFDAGTEP